MKVGDRVKIAVRLERDADDYPPADWEHLWAIYRSPNQFEIDNVPFFAMGISAADLVSVRQEGAQLVFESVLRPSAHSTIRVIVSNAAKKARVRSDLAALGCETEGSHLPSLASVDVPPEADYDAVLRYLERAMAAGELDYQEAAIRHSPQGGDSAS